MSYLVLLLYYLTIVLIYSVWYVQIDFIIDNSSCIIFNSRKLFSFSRSISVRTLYKSSTSCFSNSFEVYSSLYCSRVNWQIDVFLFQLCHVVLQNALIPLVRSLFDFFFKFLILINTFSVSLFIFLLLVRCFIFVCKFLF